MLKRVILLGLMVLTFSKTPAAADEVMIDADRIVLGNHLQYVEDSRNEFTIAGMIAHSHWSDNQGVFSKGYSSSTWWLKLVLTNPQPFHRERMLEIAAPLLDHIDLYIVAANKVRRHFRLGDKLPFRQRPIDHHFFLIPFKFPPQTTYEVFIKIESTSSIQVPLVLWRQDAFFGIENGHDFTKGFFFGALLLIAAYNLLLFFQLRNLAYIYYVCYVLTMALLQFCLQGLAFRYLWPQAVWWNDQVLVITLILISSFVNLFTIMLLEVATLSRFYYRYSIFLLGLALVFLILAFVVPYEVGIKLAILLNLLGSLCGATIGPLAWIKGRVAGKYFTLAWSALFASAFAIILNKIGLIQTSWLSVHGIKIGVTAEALLFSLCLADRINQERQARFASQQEALQAVQQAHSELEERVAERSRELDALNEQLEILSHTDQLTGLCNRRHLETLLSKEWLRCARHGRSLAVALIDIDFFKQVNDTHGHQAGDVCLQKVARRIRDGLQIPGSAVARYGGEEFCLLLPEVETLQAFSIAEGIRKIVAEAPIRVGEKELSIRVSIGLSATVPERSVHPEWLIRRADCALYRAKEEGRNRVLIYERRFEDVEKNMKPIRPNPSPKAT